MLDFGMMKHVFLVHSLETNADRKNVGFRCYETTKLESWLE